MQIFGNKSFKRIDIFIIFYMKNECLLNVELVESNVVLIAMKMDRILNKKIHILDKKDNFLNKFLPII
jgi:hypothetical protein